MFKTTDGNQKPEDDLESNEYFSTYSQIEYPCSDRLSGKQEMDKAANEEEADINSMKQEPSLNECKDEIQNSVQCEQTYNISSGFQTTHEIIEKGTQMTQHIQVQEEEKNGEEIPVYAVVNKVKKASKRQCHDKPLAVTTFNSETNKKSDEKLEQEPSKATVPVTEDHEEESPLPVYADVMIKKKEGTSKVTSEENDKSSCEYDEQVFANTPQPRDQGKEEIENDHYQRLTIPTKGNHDAEKNIKLESSGKEDSHTCQPGVDDKATKKGKNKLVVRVS